MDKHIVVGTLEPTFIEGEYTEVCGKCGRVIYLRDIYPFKIDSHVCMDCVSRMKGVQIDVADVTAKRIGLPREELTEFAKDLVDRRREERKGIGG